MRIQATALGLGGGLGVDNGISVNLSGSNVCSQVSSTGAKKAYEKLRKRWMRGDGESSLEAPFIGVESVAVWTI